MATHTTWLTHALTRAMRESRFAGAEEPLDPSGLRNALAGRGGAGSSGVLPDARPDAAWCSPAACARETAAALGLDAVPEAALRDGDPGAWASRSAAAIAAGDPAALGAWLRDPDAAPPGGESARAVLARVGAWMDGLGEGRFVVVTHAAVVRAAIVHALGAAPGCGLRIDLAPLSRTVLSRNGPWRMRLAGGRGQGDA